MGWTFLGAVDSTGQTGSSVTTGAMDTTGADLLVAFISSNLTANISDSESNTWTSVATEFAASHRLRTLYCAGPTTGAAHDFTAAGGSSVPAVTVLAFECDGLVSYQEQSDGNSADFTVIAPTLTPDLDGALLVAGIGWGGTSSTHTVDESYIETTDQDINGSNKGIGAAYKIQTTAAAQDPTFTGSASTARSVSHLVFNEINTSFDPDGIASAEAFGTAQLEDKIIYATGIASTAAFGTTRVEDFRVLPNSLASAEAFGSVVLADFRLLASGIASAEALGSVRVADFYLRPGGIAAAEAFGSVYVTDYRILPTSIAAAEAFGTALVTKDVIRPTALPPGEAFGTASLTDYQLVVSAIASAEAFGSHVVQTNIYPVGIVSAAAFGTSLIVEETSIKPTGIPSAEDVPGPLVTGGRKLPLVIAGGDIMQLQAGDILEDPDGSIYVTNAGLSLVLNDYATFTDVDTALADYYTSTAVDALVADMVEASATITDNAIVRGDGGSRGVQDSSATIADNGNLSITGQLIQTLTGNNLAIGDGTAFASLSGGEDNMAFGAGALAAVTSASDIVAMGNGAAAAITTGGSHVAIGVGALAAITTNTECVAIGPGTLGASTDGNQNVGIGSRCMTGVVTGGFNVGIGVNVLTNLTSGQSNMGVGTGSLNSLTTGGNNVAMGTGTLASLVTGDNNMAFGRDALNDFLGDRCVAVGAFSLDALTSGDRCVGIGYSSGTSNGLSTDNVYIGDSAGANHVGVGTTGRCVFIGSLCATSAAGCTNNMIIGYTAATSLTTASSCLIMGSLSGGNITTGNNNVLMGALTSGHSTTANSVFIGVSAGANVGGTETVCVGTNAGNGLGGTTNVARHNVAVGDAAGSTAVSQTSNVSNCTIIGANARTTGNNAIAVGISASAGASEAHFGTTLIADTFLYGDLHLEDGHDVVLGGTTGTAFGSADTEKLAFWGATPIVQPASANQAALTNSSGGSADGTISAVSGSGDDANINNNFTELHTLLNEIRTALVGAGLIKGSA